MNNEIPLTESHLKLLDEHGWYVVQDELGNLSCKRKETYNDKFRRELEEEYDVMMDDLRKEQRRDRKWGLFFMCCLIGAFIFGLFLW